MENKESAQGFKHSRANQKTTIGVTVERPGAGKQFSTLFYFPFCSNRLKKVLIPDIEIKKKTLIKFTGELKFM